MSLESLIKFETKPFYNTSDAVYNGAIYHLKVELRNRLWLLERARRDRNDRRLAREQIYFNKPKIKHLLRLWKTIISSEKFFRYYQNDKETSTTPLITQQSS